MVAAPPRQSGIPANHPGSQLMSFTPGGGGGNGIKRRRIIRQSDELPRTLKQRPELVFVAAPGWPRRWRQPLLRACGSVMPVPLALRSPQSKAKVVSVSGRLDLWRRSLIRAELNAKVSGVIAFSADAHAESLARVRNGWLGRTGLDLEGACVLALALCFAVFGYQSRWVRS